VLIVVDPGGALFARVSSIELGLAMWRTARDPLTMELSGDAVVLFDANSDIGWGRIQLCCQVLSTVIATNSPNVTQGLDAIRCGALGYVDTTMADEALRRTLLGVLRGEAGYTRSLLGNWLERQRSPEMQSVRTLLTQRQWEIVGLITAGATDREIAERLGIRTATAQKHVANVLRRLRVRNRAEAVGVLVAEGPRSS
jgi:DNA-binding NarL/FixJ family response regulator